jgi:hypothetical protein
MAFLSSEREHGSCLWTYPASTEAEPGKILSSPPGFFSLAMAFLSSEKGLGNILKKNSKSAALGHGLTRRQPMLSPAISLSLSVRHFARNGVPFVRNELGLGLGLGK